MRIDSIIKNSPFKAACLIRAYRIATKNSLNWHTCHLKLKQKERYLNAPNAVKTRFGYYV